MPVSNGNGSVVNINRDSTFDPAWPPQSSSPHQGPQKWKSKTVTKKTISGSAVGEPPFQHNNYPVASNARPTDLYSRYNERCSQISGMSHPPVTYNTHDTNGTGNNTNYSNHNSAPSMTDDDGEMFATREIITKSDGTKEFQLTLTARNYSFEDIQVKLTDGRLSVTGKYEKRSPSGHVFKNCFYKKCNVPRGIRQKDLHWSLDSSNRLVITAPFNEKDKRNRDFMNGEKIWTEQKDRVEWEWNDQAGMDNWESSNGDKKEKGAVSKKLGSLTKCFRK